MKRYLSILFMMLLSVSSLVHAGGDQLRGENAGIDPVDPPMIRLTTDPADGGGAYYQSPAVDESQPQLQLKWELIKKTGAN